MNLVHLLLLFASAAYVWVRWVLSTREVVEIRDIKVAMLLVGTNLVSALLGIIAMFNRK